MKLEVLKEFRDKFDHKTIYRAGEVIDIASGKRVADLIRRGLAVPLDDDQEEKPEAGENANMAEPEESLTTEIPKAVKAEPRTAAKNKSGEE